MFSSSTQKAHWMFKNEDVLAKERLKAHEEFIQRFSDHQKDFLTIEEANSLRLNYERKLMEFCTKFNPPMPKGVVGTAIQYFKRFYIRNSVMDYHPKEILVTSAYLACKVEEFNVSMDQFLHNIKGNKERATEIVLNNELLLMKELDFHLTVHNPYRPLEGLMIDVKSRAKCIGFLRDPEDLRKDIERFLDDICLTDAMLVYAPSQIALAAIIHAASKNGEHMDTYVTEVLFANVDQKKLFTIIEAVRNIRLLVKNVIGPAENSYFKVCNEKLDACRNEDNNPDSQAYKRKLQEMLDDDDERQAKHMRLDEEMITELPQN